MHHESVFSVNENEYIFFGTGSGDASDSSASDPPPDVPAYWHLDRLDQEHCQQLVYKHRTSM